MSGFVRTLEKRILKKLGYERQTHRMDPGNAFKGIPPHPVKLPKGTGQIISPAGDPIGTRWPTALRRAA